MLNIAGPEYDYAQVVYVVLQECEHHRRSFDESTFDAEVRTCANEKLAEVKAAYDEFGGSATYWETLEKEVDEVVLPQYVAAARDMNELESNHFHIWRDGDLSARLYSRSSAWSSAASSSGCRSSRSQRTCSPSR